MYKTIFIIILLHITLTASNPDIIFKTTNDKTLSRKKRYVVFPEGSSFQLVYCLTMPTYGMGQIFTIGLTAALAWELPHEPIHLKKNEKNNDDAADKRIDKPTHVDINSVYYKHHGVNEYPPWSEPASAYYVNKSRYYDPWLQNEKQSFTDKTAVGADEWNHLAAAAYRNDYLYRKHADIHRRTRRDLYDKIEKFFMAQNKDGRACLLKALCEVNQITSETERSKRGTFMEEILRAVFTWKVYEEDDIDSDINHVYTEASRQKRKCNESYPTCTQSVWNVFF